MQIGIGERIPDVELLQWKDAGILKSQSSAVLGSGKTMVIGVVGAFTPICSDAHLVDYLPIIPSLIESGYIDRVVCVGVVDPFVFHAWAQHMKAPEALEFWCDPAAEFASAIGITADFSDLGMGTRSGRYTLVLADGVVEKVSVESDPFLVSVTSAAAARELLSA